MKGFEKSHLSLIIIVCIKAHLIICDQSDNMKSSDFDSMKPEIKFKESLLPRLKFILKGIILISISFFS